MAYGQKYIEFSCCSCGYRFFRAAGYGASPGSFCPECGSMSAVRIDPRQRETLSFRQYTLNSTSSEPIHLLR